MKDINLYFSVLQCVDRRTDVFNAINAYSATINCNSFVSLSVYVSKRKNRVDSNILDIGSDTLLWHTRDMLFPTHGRYSNGTIWNQRIWHNTFLIIACNIYGTNDEMIPLMKVKYSVIPYKLNFVRKLCYRLSELDTAPSSNPVSTNFAWSCQEDARVLVWTMLEVWLQFTAGA